MAEISIQNIEGFFIGNAQDLEGGTGCTAIYCPEGASTGVDVRGGVAQLGGAGHGLFRLWRMGQKLYLHVIHPFRW